MPLPKNVFREAVRGFWDQRTAQRQAQALAGRVDQGQRADVTGGKQMDGFALMISDLLLEAGVPREALHVKKSLTVVPGFFRPTKTYDFLVVHNGQFKAALELKSHIGPSFSNNFNNRTEEAMGSAFDIWQAYREGAFGDVAAPWIGYLLLLEDCPQSRAPVRVLEPHFPVFEDFRSSSYAQRYEIFCRRMMRERQYSAACLLLSDRNRVDDDPNYTEPAADVSADVFLSSLLRQVIAI